MLKKQTIWTCVISKKNSIYIKTVQKLILSQKKKKNVLPYRRGMPIIYYIKKNSLKDHAATKNL